MVATVAAVASGLLVAPARRAQIVGGFPIDITEVPYQISLRKNGRHSCGGSIISPDWILTAAHCLVGVTEDQMSVRAGSTYKEHDGVIRNVVRMVLHPTWDPDTNEGDIALLELESPLPLDGVTMASIEMPEQGEEDPEEGSKAIVSGWGQTMNKFHSNLILRATFVPIYNRDIEHRQRKLVPNSSKISFFTRCRWHWLWHWVRWYSLSVINVASRSYASVDTAMYDR
uniref:trypsin n=1 Tax=Anopheles epiroticus TaxID=199890 RepID=A0A182P6A4_9DIPT